MSCSTWCQCRYLFNGILCIASYLCIEKSYLYSMRKRWQGSKHKDYYGSSKHCHCHFKTLLSEIIQFTSHKHLTLLAIWVTAHVFPPSLFVINWALIPNSSSRNTSLAWGFCPSVHWRSHCTWPVHPAHTCCLVQATINITKRGCETLEILILEGIPFH